MFCSRFGRNAADKVDHLNSEFDAECAPDARDVEPVQSDAAPAMAVRNLWKEFPAEKRGGSVVRAVRGFCLDVYEGEITCLLGPNGAGKSTFLAMLRGLMRPNRGSIQVFQLVLFTLLCHRAQKRFSKGQFRVGRIAADALPTCGRRVVVHSWSGRLSVEA